MDLSKKTVVELRRKASRLGVSPVSGLRKSQLIKKIIQAEKSGTRSRSRARSRSRTRSRSRSRSKSRSRSRSRSTRRRSRSPAKRRKSQNTFKSFKSRRNRNYSPHSLSQETMIPLKQRAHLFGISDEQVEHMSKRELLDLIESYEYPDSSEYMPSPSFGGSFGGFGASFRQPIPFQAPNNNTMSLLNESMRMLQQESLKKQKEGKEGKEGKGSAGELLLQKYNYRDMLLGQNFYISDLLTWKLTNEERFVPLITKWIKNMQDNKSDPFILQVYTLDQWFRLIGFLSLGNEKSFQNN